MKSILVGVDLTEMDQTLMRYASLICERYKIEDVHFIHVSKNLELPEDVAQNYSEVFANVDEAIKQKISDNLKSEFKASSEVHISVQEGNAVDKILRYAKIKNTDLILLGSKKQLKGSGVIPDSIVRKSPCHLLLIPESVKSPKIENILVPVDFSRHSHLSIEHAFELAQGHDVKISCVNIYDVPTGYSKTGKSFEEFAEIMLGHAKNDFKKFISQYNDKVECDFILSKDHDPSDELHIYVQATKPDIVFVGSKGRTDAATVLLGSMAEKMTKFHGDVPLFIVKKKGESIGIFEALMRL